MRFRGHIANLFRRLLQTQVGAGLVEYALAVGLIAVVSVGAISVVGENTLTEYDCLGSELDTQFRKKVNEKIKNQIALDAREKKFVDSCT